MAVCNAESNVKTVDLGELQVMGQPAVSGSVEGDEKIDDLSQSD